MSNDSSIILSVGKVAKIHDRTNSTLLLDNHVNYYPLYKRNSKPLTHNYMLRWNASVCQK